MPVSQHIGKQEDFHTENKELKEKLPLQVPKIGTVNISKVIMKKGKINRYLEDGILHIKD